MRQRRLYRLELEPLIKNKTILLIDRAGVAIIASISLVSVTAIQRRDEDETKSRSTLV